MDYRWQGPFAITAVLGKGLYSLKERDGNQVLINTFSLMKHGGVSLFKNCT